MFLFIQVFLNSLVINYLFIAHAIHSTVGYNQICLMLTTAYEYNTSKNAHIW